MLPGFVSYGRVGLDNRIVDRWTVVVVGADSIESEDEACLLEEGCLASQLGNALGMGSIEEDW